MRSEDRVAWYGLRVGVIFVAAMFVAATIVAVRESETMLACERGAYQAGYLAGSRGLPPQACPWGATHYQEDCRHQWLEGWNRGYVEKFVRDK